MGACGRAVVSAASIRTPGLGVSHEACALCLASWDACGTSVWFWASLSVLADSAPPPPGLHCGLLLWTPEKSFNFSEPIKQVESLLAETQAWFTAVSGSLRGAPFMVTDPHYRSLQTQAGRVSVEIPQLLKV